MLACSRKYAPLLRNTRLVMTSTLANISDRAETTRIHIDDVTFYTGGYLIFKMEKLPIEDKLMKIILKSIWG